jgi:hypothetical protein
MATREFAFTVHPALGGLDISSDPSTLDPNFLTIADNIEYREGGQRKKRPGHRIYSTAMAVSSASTAAGSIMVSTGASVRALGDYWRYGNSLTAVQDYVAVTGASIFHSTDGAGTWTPISVTSSFGLDANRTTNIIRAGDKVVFADSTSPPIAYDGTALVAATSGSLWPVFTAGRYHLNRLFYYGLSTAPSLFNYTAANNIFDSTGADAGGFTVNVGDGDQIIGVSDPFYASLYVFKGPHFGSIFQLAGATASNFALTQVAVGAPLLNNKALVTTPTDVYWLSQNGVHSLQTTVKFGNVEQAFLSLPIQRLWRDRLIDRTKIGEAWGFWHPQRNMVGWCVTPQGDTTQHWILCYNYALSDPKPGGKKFWSIWKTNVTHAHPSGAVMIVGSADTTHAGDPNLFLGTMEGQVWDGDQDYADASLNDAGEAYTASVRTPVITRFKSEKGISPETMEKSFCGVVTYFNPKGSYSADVTATIDRRVQTATVPFQGAGDTLG